MNITIVGTGLIGTLIGWTLDRGGHQVTHLVRPGRGALVAEGLTLDVLDSRPGQPSRYRGVYFPRVAEDPSEVVGTELLVYPGHHWALEEFWTQVVPRFSGATVLMVTQNWEGTGPLDAAVPKSRGLWGDIKAGGSWQDGILVGAVGALDLGAVHPEGRQVLTEVAAAFRQSAWKVEIHDDIIEYLWGQYAITGGLWPALVEAGSFSALLKDASAIDRAMDAARECLNLLSKRGVDLSRRPELALYLNSSPWARWLVRTGIRLAYRFSEWMRRTSAHALGDKAEVRAFYFDLLEASESLGHPMPVFAGYRRAVEAFLASEAREPA